MTDGSIRVHVCFGVNCERNGSQATYAAFQRSIFERGLGEQVELIATSCRDRCDWGPSVNVYPGFNQFCFVSPADVDAILDDRLLGDGKASTLRCKPGMHR